MRADFGELLRLLAHWRVRVIFGRPTGLLPRSQRNALHHIGKSKAFFERDDALGQGLSRHNRGTD